ncbi:MAG TPA: STAS domain-containing protein [Burkholderiales bacterium]|nr:STAS domain-containing protein [Burkholderiales bacterium]
MIERDGDTVRVSGALTLATVVSLRDAGAACLTAGDVMVDLKAVTEVDSSALSLLLEWRREAQRRHLRIRYSNLPSNLTSLAALYGVGEIIAGD